MTDNGIGAEGAKIVIEALKVNTALVSLNLSGEDEGIMMRKRNKMRDE